MQWCASVKMRLQCPGRSGDGSLLRTERQREDPNCEWEPSEHCAWSGQKAACEANVRILFADCPRICAPSFVCRWLCPLRCADNVQDLASRPRGARLHARDHQGEAVRPDCLRHRSYAISRALPVLTSASPRAVCTMRSSRRVSMSASVRPAPDEIVS